MEDRRLLARVALGEAEMVAFSGLDESSTSIFVSLVPASSSLSRVLFTASSTTEDGLDS